MLNQKALEILGSHSFDEKSFLENLLLDEDREVYLSLNPNQKKLIRIAWRRGWLDHEKSIIAKPIRDNSMSL